MEHFGIAQTRVAHDALGDAYNTALVCSRLDLAAGLARYDEASHVLPSCKHPREDGAEGAEPIEHIALEGHDSREDLWSSDAVMDFRCPDCGGPTHLQRWVNQGDKRYMNIAKCPEPGAFLVRIRGRNAEDGSWAANRLVYRADDKMRESYKTKSTQSRRKRRRRRKKSAK
jgi:hypothetical protein